MFVLVFLVLTKKICMAKKLRAVFYLEDILRTSSLGVSVSGNPEKTAPRRSGGAWIYRSFATKDR